MIQIPTFNELKKSSYIRPDGDAIRVALLGDTPTQLLTQALKGYSNQVGCLIDFWESDYNQVELQINNSNSELYKYNPDYIVLFLSTEKLLQKFYHTQTSDRKNFADSILNSFKKLLQAINSQSSAQTIIYNFYEIDDAVFGNYGVKTNESFIFQLRKLNHLLSELAVSHPELFIADVATDYHRIGATHAFAANIYVQSGFVWSLEFLPYASKRVVDIIKTQQGSIIKCLVLDLDDTLWGGTVGDDGWENLQLGDLGIGKAFSEFQYWIKELNKRGVILCVCSKNDEFAAREVFQKHPDMILKEEDISVFVANWNNKADNIRAIQKQLNVGFDSIVFLDNSAFERNLIRTELPDIIVPELPEDPSEYLTYLRTLNLFEVHNVTKEDAFRSQQYREEALRISSIKHFANETDYLISLNMQARHEPFTEYNTPRVAQLTQRSNQFNLRTVRYSESEIANIAQSNSHIGMAFYLMDKYGDYGLVSVVILNRREQDYFIDTWLMSCRVLKRGMEQFVMNTVVDYLLKIDGVQLVAEYIPTPKNTIVKNLLDEMQFSKNKNTYILKLKEYRPFNTEINSTHS